MTTATKANGVEIKEVVETKPANVIEAIARVMAELPGIGRDSQSPQGYNYRGIEAITAEAQKLCGKYVVVFVPKVVSRKTIEITVNGKPWTEEQLEVVYTVYGPGGVTDFIEVGPLWGLGRDNSDKGANKAETQAYKYALIQVFQIGDSKADADNDKAHETDARPAADPEVPFTSIGWKDRAEQDAWRQHYTAEARKLTEEQRKEFKADAEALGLVWKEPIPKPVADDVDKLIAEYQQEATSPGEAPEQAKTAPPPEQAIHRAEYAGRVCDGCKTTITPTGGCECPF